MSSLTTLEKIYFEDLFGTSSGYVLNFTNESFSRLFYDTVKINIYHDKYAAHGDSKARRMRSFWELETDPIVGKVLSTILEVWKYENDKHGKTTATKGYSECRRIVNRLLGKVLKESESEEDFLKRDFGEIKIGSLKIDSALIPILEYRIKEAGICLQNNAPLSAIFLCGSVLEGILLAVATQNSEKFCRSASSPKDRQGKVRPLPEWALANYIDVACEIELLGLDVKKFSHALRDFRNYIHPYEQMMSKFNPDKDTADICMHVLEAAIADLSKK